MSKIKSRETTLGTFTDDTAIYSTQEDPTIVSRNLQQHLTHHRKMAREMKN